MLELASVIRKPSNLLLRAFVSLRTEAEPHSDPGTSNRLLAIEFMSNNASRPLLQFCR